MAIHFLMLHLMNMRAENISMESDIFRMKCTLSAWAYRHRCRPLPLHTKWGATDNSRSIQIILWPIP